MIRNTLPLLRSLLDETIPFGPLALARPVGPRRDNRRSDVAGLERALGLAGILDPLESGTPGAFTKETAAAVKRFQRAQRLKVDGLLNPNGPTQAALSKLIARMPAPPALSNDTFSANGRLLDALARTAEDGMVPRLLADDFQAGGDLRAKTVDLLRRLGDGDRERAKDLRGKVRPLLADNDDALLTSLITLAGESGEAKPDDPFRPPIGDADDGEEPPQEPTPEPDKKPSRIPDECLELWLDAREADKRLSAVLVALVNNEIQTEALEAKVPKLEREITELRLELVLGGIGGVRALAKKAGALLAAEAAKGGAVSRKLEQKEAELRSVQQAIEKFKEEKKKLKKQEEKLKKESDILNAKLKACMNEHGDKA